MNSRKGADGLLSFTSSSCGYLHPIACKIELTPDGFVLVRIFPVWTDNFDPAGTDRVLGCKAQLIPYSNTALSDT